MNLKNASVADMKKAIEYMWDGKRGPSDYYTSRMASLAEIRDAYAGGRRALRFLERKPGESNDQWNARRALFQNVRFVRVIVDSKAGMLYGNAPERCFYIEGLEPDDPQNEALDDTIGSVYSGSNVKVLMRQKVAPARFRDSESNVKVVVTGDDEKPIRLAYLPSQCVLWVPDPDDVDAVLGCVEIRPRGRGFRMTAHTMEQTLEINDSWEPIIAESDVKQTDQPIVPGMLPIVRFGSMDLKNDFGSWTDDAILDQKHLINTRSQFALGMRAGAFPVLVIAGRIKGTTYQGEDGKERILISPESAVELEEGGTAQFLNPGFPLTEASEVEKGWRRMGLESYAVSGYTVDPSGAPEQPMALLIKMFEPLMKRSEDVAEAEEFESDLAKVVKATAAELGMISVDPKLIRCDIEFPKDVLPMDKQAARVQDAADVAATPPRMTIEDYVKRHIMADASDQDVAEYMIKLAEQSGQVTAARASIVGSLAPRTGIFERLGTPAPAGPPINYVNESARGGGREASSSGPSGPGPVPGGSGSGGKLKVQ